ncbi:hypothetical protein MZO42_03085 [Sphingomonas psychrotolerans]|uniref:Uncharacterized protein n=1 Tax=Sphingomonas psychrotolerans TaxID=1327635 RepID=A0ABU3MZX6_9SPHN|nr:hypothetical protein [Sphingomonas psychrotolerans]MDT8757673.1 hypothetical protein [Sphingomonas psychrotolerans]
MAKSATDLMQEILFSTVLDSIVALKDASNGLPNPLLRELNSIHPNTTFADLPKEVQGAIATNVRSAFTRLLKEGYSVAPQGSEPRRAPPAASAPTHRPRGGAGGERRPPRSGGPGPKRGPGGGGSGSKPPRRP